MAKKKRNVWTDPSPYGTYEGERGSPQQWRAIFDQIRGEVKAAGLTVANPYEVLGLTSSATFDEAQRAFRKLILEHHPDKGGDEEKCRQILDAFAQIKETCGE